VFNRFGLFEKKPSKIILDEGLMYPRFMIAELYYELGRQGMHVLSFGTE
jgi:hypothetical protein